MTLQYREPLTPIHLITGRRLMSVHDGLCYQRVDDDMEVTPILLNKRLKHLNRTNEYFWTCWRSEYLLGLREHHRISINTSKGSKVSVGDVVIIHKDNQKVGFWDLGTVREIIPGKDALVRGVVIRICSSGKIITHLRLSVRHLYPLEINCNDLNSPTSTAEQTSTNENRNSTLSSGPIDNAIERRP